MPDALKKIHKDGFLVITTKIGDITIALPDAEDSENGFELTIDDEDGIAEKVILDFIATE